MGITLNVPTSVAEKRIAKLPADARAVIEDWLARQTFYNMPMRRDFLNDAYTTVTRQLACDKKCCAGMSREERLAELRSLQGGSDAVI